ncbi:ABC transporter permease [Ancylobacter lacus]|uniref:ABC transporter permease n=1 Tax=Ancylobacter lacus TaxID=2579970 RepID=UPI001BCA99BD|nr:ABC transporter permease subunit [Ancylobacter lacus]MBS7538244.1 ABC transporter permease subunit [Ancylobacter lacus]
MSLRRLLPSAGLLAFTAYAALIYLFLYLPIAVIALFAFDSRAISGLPLAGFTTQWFAAAFADPALAGSMATSARLAAASALLATALAMPAAMVLAWFPLRWKSAVLALMLGPVVLPPLVLGLGLVMLARAAPGMIGEPAIIIAHATMTSSYAALMLYSRLLGFRRSYIEAAMDLGATEWVVFREIVLPLTAPALVAVFLLAFTDAFGEFIVAWFVAGFTKTLPIVIWTSLRQVISPKINAVSTLIIAATLLLSVASQLWILRQAGRARES